MAAAARLAGVRAAGGERHRSGGRGEVAGLGQSWSRAWGSPARIREALGGRWLGPFGTRAASRGREQAGRRLAVARPGRPGARLPYLWGGSVETRLTPQPGTPVPTGQHGPRLRCRVPGDGLGLSLRKKAAAGAASAQPAERPWALQSAPGLPPGRAVAGSG